jgi:hypothetical protein
MSSLDSALEVLTTQGFLLGDLPVRTDDPMWAEIRTEFKLSLGQICALKNYASSGSAASLPEPVSPSGPVGVPPTRSSDLVPPTAPVALSADIEALSESALQQVRTKETFYLLTIVTALNVCHFVTALGQAIHSGAQWQPRWLEHIT